MKLYSALTFSGVTVGLDKYPTMEFSYPAVVLNASLASCNLRSKVVEPLLFLITSVAAYCQGKESINNDLPVKWEELTAPDFIKAVEKSGATCVIPLGIMEKHGHFLRIPRSA